ncbi:hypothetical protein [Paenibacillus sp. BC26]|uniref:hypothetical protein n=1 Tax=Paenibacillus sp. BC26 TaxID=1881032 RepID=UPI0008F10FE0|nr:hypothetical protein [Paenibacillus sp. BC26]SFS83930.1 hypothetical protein SAMN05428962_3173 [Paenibacillus sp. BC26]
MTQDNQQQLHDFVKLIQSFSELTTTISLEWSNLNNANWVAVNLREYPFQYSIDVMKVKINHWAETLSNQAESRAVVVDNWLHPAQVESSY